MSRQSRRELLKMAPLAAAGVLLFDRSREWLLGRGVALSDAASARLFRSTHLAKTFSDREVTPLDKYPLNSYLVDDPEVDLAAWKLDVSGLVQKPAQYTLDQIRTLPKVVQNTQHVCVEGWAVIGNYGGVRV